MTIPAKYQTIWRRIGGNAIDGLLVILPISVAHDFVYTHSSSVGWHLAVHLLRDLALPLYIIVLTAHGGQTIGKRIAGVVVLRHDEQPIGYGRSIARLAVPLAILAARLPLSVQGILDGVDDTAAFDPRFPITPGELVFGGVVLVWYVADFLTALLSTRRRALHDFIAGTQVVCTSARAPEVPAAG